MTTWTYTRSSDRVLTVRMANGRRRTLRISEIVDLVEKSDAETEVVYRSGQRITVPMAFDALFEAWVGEEWEAA